MRDKKKMIAIGGAALALIAIASVAVTLVHKNSGLSDEDMINLAENVGNGLDDRLDGDGKIEGTDLSGYRIPEHGNYAVPVPFDESMLNKDVSDNVTPKNINREYAVPERQIVLNNADEYVYEENVSESPDEEDVSDIRPIKSTGYKEHEVICNAQSMEEAESIANEISGTLLSLNYGTATIQIEESVDELLARLEQEGSSLQLYRHYIFGTQN